MVGTRAGRQGCDALTYVGYFAELLDEWAQDADADERLYRLGASMLDALAAARRCEPLARYFEYWLLRLQGVYPEARGHAVRRARRRSWRRRGRWRRSDVGCRAGRRPGAEGAGNVHRALITMHLEKTLKSDRVLRDLRRHA